MNKEIIEYEIPIQDQTTVNKSTRLYMETFGDDVFASPFCKPFKTTDEHIGILMSRFEDAIEKVGNYGGWYIGDSIKVKIELEYEPENK